jgi:ABC-type sugar transport system ATPase subunit
MIRIENLSVHAGDFALRNVSLEVPLSGYAVLMGQSGSGKTTLLEAITGLKRVSAGRVFLNEREVTHWGPAQRGIGYVPQDGALFTTMSVREHIAFALVVRRVRRAAIRQRVAEMADLLELTPLLDRTPATLSGGEKQRVALARALSFRPAWLCLDEPLSALDAQMRRQMQCLLLRVREHTGVTTLHVTHHPHDATSLADALYLLAEGRIERRPLSSVRQSPTLETFNLGRPH